MTVDAVMDMASRALYTVLETALPVLLVSLCVGLVVSIFQTVTSIQEQTLTFVPKMVGMFLTLMLIGHWMLNGMTTFMEELWANFSLYIQ